jgi:predicted deacetylase
MMVGRGAGRRTAGWWCRSWVAADEQDLLALLRHHVAQVGEREALADAALAVDGDDLGLLW